MQSQDQNGYIFTTVIIEIIYNITHYINELLIYQY